jgi:chromatin remodeling complex protein RSC6
VPEPAAASDAAAAAAAAAAPVLPGRTALDRLATISDRVTDVMLAIKDITASLKEVATASKLLQKDIVQLQKDGAKRGGRKAAAAAAAAAVASGDASAAVPARRPSGFIKPVLLSSALCQFLAVPEGTLMARNEVTRMLTQYVKDNKLYDEADKRTLHPDEKLLQLMTVAEGEKLTYFNLQSHIKHNFIKPEVEAAAPAVAAAAPETPVA